MQLFGKRANLPVACLALLAALVPDHHQVTLLHENVDDIDFDRPARAGLRCPRTKVQGQGDGVMRLAELKLRTRTEKRLVSL
jgi:hypothetical protein